MATITLSPIADYSVGLNYQYPEDSGSHYAKILSADDDSSYIANKQVSGYQYDIFRLPIFALGTINSVSIYIRGWCGSSLNSFKPGFFNLKNQTYAWGTERNSTSYTTYTDTWTTNPFTGLAWTLNDLSQICLAVGAYNTNSSWQTRITQMYVVIDYTPYGESYEVIRPDNWGSYTDIDSQEGSGNHYELVDDDINYPDEDSTDVKTTSTSYLVDTYALSDISSSDILHIKAVVVHFRIRGTAGTSGASGKPALYTNSGLYYGTEQTGFLWDTILGNAGYITCAHVWTTNPATGLEWTKAEVQALQAGVAVMAESGSRTVRVTAVSVTVHYTVDQAPATPSTPSGNTVGAPTVSYSFSTSTTDPESDTVTYTFDWGDGNQDTTRSYASGASASASHSWSTPGTYTVKVMATDSLGATSGWSSTTTIVIASPGSYARVMGLW